MRIPRAQKHRHVLCEEGGSRHHHLAGEADGLVPVRHEDIAPVLFEVPPGIPRGERKLHDPTVKASNLRLSVSRVAEARTTETPGRENGQAPQARASRIRKTTPASLSARSANPVIPKGLPGRVTRTRRERAPTVAGDESPSSTRSRMPLVAFALRQGGFLAVEASTGERALQLAEQEARTSSSST